MINEQPAAIASPEPDACPHCGKPASLCVCEGIRPIENKIALLILQHPQEQDRDLGTARLTARHFTNATLKIGLSWPGLAKILGHPVDPQRWAVLYLGSVKPADIAGGRDVIAVNRKGEPEPDQDESLRYIEGIILLDGTWSQAKALWWRNPWMLKCRRVVLGPSRPSAYGKLRREPRREGLSTIESAAMLLARLEHKPEIEVALNESFDRLLALYRGLHPQGASAVRSSHRQRRRGPPKRR
ncbi:MAG: tRNA-uridine aminocarboxypropyltransferase [Xanthobacteraceae bacterium]